MKLTFFGGVNEIGGNKILLEDEKRVYLDFGMPFGFGDDYFLDESYLKPRDGADGMAPYFELGLVPKVKKLYSEAMLRHCDLKYEKPDIDAVFVSHHHSDHVGELKFLDESIPIHMGHGTHAIMDAYAKLYPGFGKYGKHDVREFKSGDAIPVGPMTFRPIHVEHSTPGAYGYVIERDEGNIVFTGDLRMHGQRAEMTEEFVREAKKASPALMLCEGTRMTEEEDRVETGKEYTEDGVKKKVCSVTEDSKGLVFVHFAMSNVDRFRSIWEACRDAGRKLVIDPRYAYLLEVMKSEGMDWLPDMRDDMSLYYRLNSKGDWGEQPYEAVWRDYYAEELDDSWFNIDKNGKKSRKKGMWRCKDDMGKRNVTFKEIRENPTDYALFINFSKLTEMCHLKPERADYIYSSSEHFLEGEENEKMRTVMKNWLNHFGVELHKAHCSGHAAAEDIERMVKKVKPDLLIPIHTLAPERFKDFCEAKLVERGEKVEI